MQEGKFPSQDLIYNICFGAVNSFLLIQWNPVNMVTNMGKKTLAVLTGWPSAVIVKST